MNLKTLAIAAIGAVAIGAVGYLVGVEVSGRGPSAAVTEAAIKGYLADHPELVAAPAADTKEVALLSDAQLEQVKETIRSHLVANPEIVRDAIDALQRKQDEEAAQAQVSAITNNKDTIFNSQRQVVIGNPDGDVTLVEFFDYNCGYCRRAQADMKALIADDPNLRVVLKEFPVLGEGSVEAARVSIAVRMVAPDKAADFHDTLLDHPGQVNGDVALALAEELGIDSAALKKAMDSEEVSDTIAESYALATELSLTGTPSYVTNSEVVIGAVGYDALLDKIKTARANCADSTTC
ncbi:MAG: DsbA family protein [Bauldia sp.]|nr:DsbA family protein [Bauldia sp.]